MICRLAILWLVVMFSAGTLQSAPAERLPLVNGSVLEGEPVSFNTSGVVIKLASGEFAPREAWTNFTQAALKQLAAHPKAKVFVEPYLEEEAEPEGPRRAAVELKLKDVPRLDRPNPKTSSLFASPLSVTVFLLLYLANLYAGLEVSRYRRQPLALVCGLAAVAPVIAPIVFLSLPTRIPTIEDGETFALPQDAPASEAQVEAPGSPAAEAPAAEAGQAPQPTPPPPPTIYRRPHTTFNRRFFETKLAGFLRVVPGEAEKDMFLCVSSTRGNYVSQRIVRILPNEILLQVKKGDATADVIIPFNEINEVQVRHRESLAAGH